MNKDHEWNILFTSSGRRVSLIRKFRETMQLNQIKGKIVTADLKNTAPTAFLSDRHTLVPRVTDEHYLERLLHLCIEEQIRILIPLIDTELVLLSRNKHLFEDIGVQILVSDERLVELSGDKYNTFDYFTKHGIPTPKVYSNDEILNKAYAFPLLIKPLDGSASRGVTKIANEKELQFFKEYIPNALVQEYITGQEYTVDVMVDFAGNIKTIVPRLRLETRAGEVSKGVTKKDPEIIRAVERVIKALPGPAGCITLQCFKQPNGEISFIEINPRFGGGVPLAIEAGANFPLWTIQMCLGETFTEPDYTWKENLTMLRYDEAIFTESIQYAN